MRRRTLIATGSSLLLVTVAALTTVGAPSAVAGGSTSLGETSGSGGLPQGADARTLFQHASADGPSYVIPSGGGVITSWSVALDGATSSPTTVALEVGIPQYTSVGAANPTSYLIDDADERTVPAQAATTVYSFPDVRVPVKAASELGIWSSGPAVTTRGVSGAQIEQEQAGNGHTSPPVPNSVVSYGTTDNVSNYILELSANVEPDADGDGFGDTTQDQCPADRDAQLQPCPAHLSTSVTVGAATGNGLPVTTVVQNTGTATASDLTLGTRSTSGLAVLSAHSSQGSCSSPTSCQVGSIDPGQSVTVTQDVLPTASGSQSVTETLTSSQPLLGTTSATELIEVAPGSVPHLTVCKVPGVVGLTSAKAKAALSRAHCKAGFIKVAKLKKGQSRSKQRVLTQSSKKGQLLLKGGTVNLTVGIKK